MRRHSCFRRGCTRIRSEFSIFLKRRPPVFEGHPFCSEACLQAHIKDELSTRWQRLRHHRERRIPRPRLGAILMQTAFITREQLDEAVRRQRETREGRLGQWLLRLGFADERQITAALARQFGVPMIDLRNLEARSDALGMIPAPVARFAGVLPVRYDGGQDLLQVAVSAPVNFNVQQALRRMLDKGVGVYIGDDSAIQSRLDAWYSREEFEPSNTPCFGSLEELLAILKDAVSHAVRERATGIRAELMDRYFWIRVDFGASSQHHFYRDVSTAAQPEAARPLHDREYALAYNSV